MISYKKLFHTFIFILFVGYLVLYFSYKNGYYEDINSKKTRLTEEKIKQFEEDVKKGKEIKVENYTTEVIKNYNNRASSFGLFTSKVIGNTFSWSITKIFSGIDKMMNN